MRDMTHYTLLLHSPPLASAQVVSVVVVMFLEPSKRLLPCGLVNRKREGQDIMFAQHGGLICNT